MTTISIAQQTLSLSLSRKENNIMATIQLWMDRHAQRKQLKQLSYAQLDDMGLTHKIAQAEASKPFWK